MKAVKRFAKLVMVCVSLCALLFVLFVSCAKQAPPPSNSNVVDDGGDGDDDVIEYVTNPDELALTYDRLENADFNFNWNIDLSNDATTSSDDDESSDDDMIEETEYSKIFEVTYAKMMERRRQEQELFDQTGQRYVTKFEAYDISYDSELAQGIVDYAIDNVTVLDQVVSFWGWDCLLRYDRENDAVYLYAYEGQQSESYVVIKVYYNDEGDEVVEMTRVIDISKIGAELYALNPGHSIQERRIVYIKDKRCSCYLHDTFENGEQYQYGFDSFVVDGKWYGIDFSSNIYGGRVGFDILEQDGDNIYSWACGLYQNTDSIEMNSFGFNIGTEHILQIYRDNFTHAIFYNINLIGWDKIVIKWDTAAEFNSYNEYNYPNSEGQGIGDYVELSNGDRILPQSVWCDGEWIEPIWTNVGDENGYAEWQCDYVGGFSLENSECMVFNMGTNTYDKLYHTMQANYFEFVNNNMTLGKFMQTISQCLDANGLNNKYNYDLTAICEDLLNDTTFVYNKFFGDEISLEAYLDRVDQLANCYTELLEECLMIFDVDYEILPVEQLPKMPENAGLVKLEENLNGAATISQNSIDFSAMSFVVNPTPILISDKHYGVFVGWGSVNGGASVDAFTTEIFEQKQMQFVGKTGVLLPQICSQGDYLFKMFFGKNEEGWLRLSEMINVPVDQFEEIIYNVDVDGGYYVHTISFVDGMAVLNVQLVDEEAPKIYFVSQLVDNDQIDVEFDEETSIEVLLNYFTARDNIDGVIEISVDMLEKSGEKVQIDDAVEEGQYVLSVLDNSGNVATVVINVIYNLQA